MRSMTGYGRAEDDTSFGHITVEIRCWNHKHADFKARFPRSLVELESRLIECLREELERGRIEVSLDLRAGEDSPTGRVNVNLPLAREYFDRSRELGAHLEIHDHVPLEFFLRLPEILSVEETPLEAGEVWDEVRPIAIRARQAVVEMRMVEGAELLHDFEHRFDLVSAHVASIEGLVDEARQQIHDRIRSRMRELLSESQIDDNRILNEAALMAERSDITEELVRLGSHLRQARVLINDEKPKGRRIEFLLQEMLRETNTIGSKSQHIDIVQNVLAIKAELDKLREQVLNVE